MKILSLSDTAYEYEGKLREKWIVNKKWESNKGKWNEKWEVGGLARGVFNEVKGKNGKTFYRINCPPELMPKGQGSGSFGGGDTVEVLNKILQEVLIIRTNLVKTSQTETAEAVTEEPQAVTEIEADETKEPTEEELNATIPF